jgi:uncharacterized protein YbjT (DUF2867 family)
VKVLVTGARGRTGQAIVPALLRAGHTVRFLTRQVREGGPLARTAGMEPAVGDLGSDADVARAMSGTDAVYHIPPNMNPDEIPFGKRVVAAAVKAGARHFVYHSVLRPQLRALTHHWNKLFVEEAVIESGLPFTILQPSSYMQNVLTDWKGIVDNGVHTLGFSVAAKLSLVDLEDVAAVAAKVLGNPAHFGAIYELCGSEAVSGEDKANALGVALGKRVRAAQETITDFKRKALAGGIPKHVVETRAAMFEHYDHAGLVGNANVLEWLLGRKPTSFLDFARRLAARR